MRSEAVPSASSRLFSPLETVMRPAACLAAHSNPPARDRVCRNQVEVVAASRDDDWPPECLAQQHSRNTIRIEVVRINQVGVEPFAHLAP